MDNRDPTFSGALKVFIPGIGWDKDDTKNWIIANYAPPFFGTTPDDQRSADHFDSAKKSYGMFMVPPDIGNQVLVAFIRGDINRCYWFACVPEFGMNRMVPGVPEGKAIGYTGLVPTTEYNRAVEESKETVRPAHIPLVAGISKQGLMTDGLRGAGSSGVRRETPSRVQGFLTPGGTQVVFDDGYLPADAIGKSWADDPLTKSPDDSPAGSASDDTEVGIRRDAMIRFRTRSGAQLLISETEGHIYAISRDGQSWFELNNDGFIDGFASRDISFRAEGNLNLKADKNINIESGTNVQIKAGTNFILNAGQSCSLKSGTDLKVSAGSSISFAAADDFAVSGLTVGMCATGVVVIESTGTIGIQSNSDLLLTGASALHLNGPVIGEGPTPKLPDTVTSRALMDKRVTGIGSYSNVSTKTICSRAPSHEPWPDHTSSASGYRGVVEEGEATVPEGAVVPEPDKPLPICGTPREGMETGAYQGVGYSSDKQPLYEITGGVNMSSASSLKTSSAGISMIRQYEGAKNKVYLDSAGLKTIGVGHLLTSSELSSGVISLPSGNVQWANGITNAQMDELLALDVRPAEASVRANVKVPLTQAQFDSLVSFTFNVGTGAFKSSTMLKELNAGNYGKVPSELMRWNKAGGKEVRGLTTRRQNEGLAFSDGGCGAV